MTRFGAANKALCIDRGQTNGKRPEQSQRRTTLDSQHRTAPCAENTVKIHKFPLYKREPAANLPVLQK